jgi:hypothetical protein
LPATQARRWSITMEKARRGFACMTPERRREVAQKGGSSVPPDKRSFSRDRDLAATAGRAGGEAKRDPAASEA